MIQWLTIRGFLVIAGSAADRLLTGGIKRVLILRCLMGLCIWLKAARGQSLDSVKFSVLSVKF